MPCSNDVMPFKTQRRDEDKTNMSATHQEENNQFKRRYYGKQKEEKRNKYSIGDQLRRIATYIVSYRGNSPNASLVHQMKSYSIAYKCQETAFFMESLIKI